MNHLLIIHEGKGSPELDALAANGRLGMIEGWSGLDCLFGEQADGDGCITLTCGIASLDSQRNVSGFLADRKEAEELLEMINSTEIDGVKFQAEARGSDIILKLDGEGLSRKIVPNPCTPGMPLAQVCASSKEGKRTASALNKLIYRITKNSPESALFVRKVGSSRSPPEGFEVMQLNGAISAEFLSRIKNSSDLVTILISQPDGGKDSSGSAHVLIHGGGILPGSVKKFCGAACSRGFRIGAEDFLPWVMRATGGTFK